MAFLKFKTRLWITFVTIIILPVILTAIAFACISFYVINSESKDYGIEIKDEQGSKDLKQSRPDNRLNAACVYLLYTYKVTSP